MMRVLLVTAAILAVAYSATLVNPNNKHSDELENILNDAEDLYENVPRDLMEDAKLKVPELIRKYGYPCEEHTVISNGYILGVHRIPYGRKGPSKDRPAVYLQHGILASGADWVVPGPEKGFAYVLADAGYDVWIPNVRGTRYSRAHQKLDPDENAAEFWDFSWHEIALEDVPKMIDYVIEQTGQEKIFYIGHSQGTTVFYVMASELPQYNAKIRAQFSLAPIGFMKHLFSPIMRFGALWEPVIDVFAKWFGMHEFLPHSEVLGSVATALCGDDSILQVLCTNSLFAVCGFNKNQMNATLLPVIMGHTPAGTSTKQFLHFAQEINSGYFRKYDYGRKKNKKIYNNAKPPNYNMGKVTAPVYLHWSSNDWMSDERDVLKLYNQLGNVQAKLKSPDKKFNHVDYVYGIEARSLLYNRILGLMTRH